MFGLMRKELRSLRPFLALAIFIPVINLVYEFLTDPPHLRPLAATLEEYIAGSRESSIAVFVIIFALASGLLVREYDEGTMEFLDALPLSRTRIFLTKVAMACSVPLVLIVLDMGNAVVLHALSRNSLDMEFHWAFLGTALLLRSCQAVVSLSIGLALSFLRRFGWLCLGVLFWAYLWLHQVLPAIQIIDLFAIAEPKFHGLDWQVPWRQVGVQLALAGVLLTLAYGLFLGIGDRFLRSYHRIQQSLAGRIVLWSGSVLIVVVGVMLIDQAVTMIEADEKGDLDPETNIRVVYQEWGVSRAATEHYEFLYPNNLAGRGSLVVAGAEATHERVRSFLEAESGPQIVVDMTGYSSHNAGRAHWDKIQMDLTSYESADMLQAVLGHETTHVYLDRLSDSRLSDAFGSTRFFHEGVASYVEYRLFRSQEDLDRQWSVAAVMRARKQVHFDELVDDERLRAKLDANLAYPLGEVFTEALVDTYGCESVGKICRALTRDDAPEDLAGQDLWRDVLQACGYNLEIVIDAFYAKLDEQVAQHRELIDRLPRLRGAVDVDHGFVTVRTVWDRLEGWQPVCRFRQAEDTPDQQYLFQIADEQDEFSIASAIFPSGVCWYQLGLSDGHDRVIYEPWQTVNVRQ